MQVENEAPAVLALKAKVNELEEAALRARIVSMEEDADLKAQVVLHQQLFPSLTLSLTVVIILSLTLIIFLTLTISLTLTIQLYL